MESEPIVNKKALIVLLIIAVLIAGFVIYQRVTDTCNTSKCQADRIIEQYEKENE